MQFSFLLGRWRYQTKSVQSQCKSVIILLCKEEIPCQARLAPLKKVGFFNFVLGMTVGEVYNKYKESDGFLYIEVSDVNAYG